MIIRMRKLQCAEKCYDTREEEKTEKNSNQKTTNKVTVAYSCISIIVVVVAVRLYIWILTQYCNDLTQKTEFTVYINSIIFSPLCSPQPHRKRKKHAKKIKKSTRLIEKWLSLQALKSQENLRFACWERQGCDLNWSTNIRKIAIIFNWTLSMAGHHKV